MRRVIYGLYINLDERGEFYADVRDVNDKTVFEINTEEAEDLVEGGFIKDPREPDEIESYLKDAGIIPQNGFVYDMQRFEQLQERYLENKKSASLSL